MRMIIENLMKFLIVIRIPKYFFFNSQLFVIVCLNASKASELWLIENCLYLLWITSICICFNFLIFFRFIKGKSLSDAQRTAECLKWSLTDEFDTMQQYLHLTQFQNVYKNLHNENATYTLWTICAPRSVLSSQPFGLCSAEYKQIAIYCLFSYSSFVHLIFAFSSGTHSVSQEHDLKKSNWMIVNLAKLTKVFSRRNELHVSVVWMFAFRHFF